MREREFTVGRTLSAARGLQEIYATIYFPCVALVVQVVVAKTLINRYNSCSSTAFVVFACDVIHENVLEGSSRMNDSPFFRFVLFSCSR